MNFAEAQAFITTLSGHDALLGFALGTMVVSALALLVVGEGLLSVALVFFFGKLLRPLLVLWIITSMVFSLALWFNVL